MRKIFFALVVLASAAAVMADDAQPVNAVLVPPNVDELVASPVGQYVNSYKYFDISTGPVPFFISGLGMGYRYQVNKNAIDMSANIRTVLFMSNFEERVAYLRFANAGPVDSVYYGAGICAQQVYCPILDAYRWCTGAGPQFVLGKQYHHGSSISFRQIELNWPEPWSNGYESKICWLPQIVIRVGFSF